MNHKEGRMMGYAVYEDPWNHGRWAGYAVPAVCDWPDCDKKIYRGMDNLCESHYETHYEDEEEVEETVAGCHLHFCEEHKYLIDFADQTAHWDIKPKGDSVEWMWWLVVAPSWAQWRIENPQKVEEYRAAIAEANYRPTKDNLVDLKWDMEDCGVMPTQDLEDQ